MFALLVFLLCPDHVVSVLGFGGPRGRSPKFGTIVALSQYGYMGWCHTAACLLTVARCRSAACRNSTLPERHLTRTAPHWNATLPEDSGPACAELHTAESRRVTVQEGLGNGYIRSKLLPLVDMNDMTFFFSSFLSPFT